MRISLRMEGGAGDCLCANRFIPAIRECYPNATIDAFLDTEGNLMQEGWLRKFYPTFYNDIITIPAKKYNPFVTNSQFGTETRFAGLENIPDEYKKRMESYDKFFNFHIDGLDWIKGDLIHYLLPYFYHFPRPKIINNPSSLLEADIKIHPKFAFLNLIPDSCVGNKNVCEPWYYKQLVKKLAENIFCNIIVTEKTKPLLQHLAEIPNVSLVQTDIDNVAWLISKASIFIGIDSGLKYLAQGLGIPRIIFAEWSNGPHSVPPSHRIRWLVCPEDFMPVNYDCHYVKNLALKLVENPILSIVPTVQDLNRELIIRQYTVDIEKSKLQ